MSLTPATTVLVVDDNAVVGRGVAAVLADAPDFHVLGVMTDAAGLVAVITEVAPQLVVASAEGPAGVGTRGDEIRRRMPSVRWLVYAHGVEHRAVAGAARCGAGFVLTASPPQRLVEAAATVAAGGRYLDPAVTSRLFDRLRNHAPAGPGPLPTPTERRVLAHLAAGRANADIAMRMQLADKTVRNYVSRLVAKLGVGRTELAGRAVELGLVEPPAPSRGAASSP